MPREAEAGNVGAGKYGKGREYVGRRFVKRCHGGASDFKGLGGGAIGALSHVYQAGANGFGEDESRARLQGIVAPRLGGIDQTGNGVAQLGFGVFYAVTAEQGASRFDQSVQATLHHGFERIHAQCL